MAVEMADRVSSRRMAANGFFLSVNTAIAGFITLIYTNSIVDEKRVVATIISLVGLLITATWFFAIRSYRRLNAAKFAVINSMEQNLPVQYFSEEWKNLTASSDDLEPATLRRRWIQLKDRYTTLTNIESFVPLAFGLLYIIVLVGVLFGVSF